MSKGEKSLQQKIVCIPPPLSHTHTSPSSGVFYEQGKLDDAIATYKRALAAEPSFPEAYNNLGNALREAGRHDEAVACYTMCIQLQLRQQQPQMQGGMMGKPALPGAQQAQRLSVAYNNLGGILKMQVCVGD